MSDEQEEKQLKDFTDVVDVEIPKVVAAVAKNPAELKSGLETLLALEKQTRLAADVPSTKKLAGAILELCFTHRQWALLNEHITLLCKRRAQLTKVMELTIRTGCGWVENTPDKSTKLALIHTLRKVSMGKMFVELERARLTKTLTDMLEADGKIDEAADTLQDVQVETIGAMEVREKADFLLEQVRLMLARNDFIRAAIISRKVNTSVLEKDDMQDLKLKYYKLMIQYHAHEKDNLATYRSYHAIFRTKSVQEDEKQWKEALQHAIIFLVLSQWDSEVSDLFHRMKAEKLLAKVPISKQLITLFTTTELMVWPLSFNQQLASHPVFSGSEGKERMALLEKRVTQHNIRTVSTYYGRITLQCMSGLLRLPESKVEREVSELVSSKQLYAKIDRPAGIITFARKESPNDTLNNWAGDISKLLTLVQKTTHLISRERMLYGKS